LPVHPREAAQSTRDLAADYINTDCTSDALNAVEAYHDLEAAERARMHDARADELESQGEFSWSLGAVPYHRERGSDAAGMGAQALYAAVDHCVCNGFYDAAVDLGKRGLELADPVEQPDRWWTFVIATGLSLSVLSRTREAQELFETARGCSTRPTVHMALAYSIAMLYTRHNDPAERNERQAKAWLNSAIATASLVKDPAERAFLSAFYRNGLALVEVNLGDPQEALRLVNHCIDSLDELLDPEDHRLHRTVLKNNRARVFSMLGRFDEALADYAFVIDADPNHAEHYLERGNILRRLGQPAQALAGYSTAIRLSPPFPEIYYNRADLLLAEGDTNGALADLDYVLELDPSCVDAYVNRAGIHLSEDRLDAALDDAHAGLAVEPENAHLRAALGQIMTDRGEHTAALREYDRALAAEPTLLAALAGRACALAGTGDLAAATVDLDRAIELEPADPALRFNRAIVHIEAGRRQQARRDLMRAAELAPDDDDIACALARELEVAEAGRDSVLSQV
jgi:tetratricopeptide (TPR) repeat protein